MGSYVLYKCKMKFVDYVEEIPKPIKEFLDYKGYVPDKETVMEELEDLDDQTHNEEIIKFCEKHDLFDYDLKMEYD